MDWVEKWYNAQEDVIWFHTVEEIEKVRSMDERKFSLLILEDVVFPFDFNEVSEFLRSLESLLYPEGHILILTYNRLGLCFFSGTPEISTGVYYLGLSNYNSSKTYNTYSRKEWTDILDNSGYDYRFYYPYPNHKEPCEIFSDATINQYGYGRAYGNRFLYRYELFNEQCVTQSLTDECVMQVFANSFMIELNPSNTIIEYTKYSTNRKKEFAIVTSIQKQCDTKIVKKKAIWDEGCAHIQDIYKWTKDEALKLLSAKRTDDRTIQYEFLTGESLEEQMVTAINTHNIDVMSGIIQLLYDFLVKGAKESFFATEEFQKVFGTCEEDESVLCISPANIDMILDNIYVKDETILVIDGEWIFSFNIPIKFILWRAINEFYGKHPAAERELPYQALCDRYEISELEQDKYKGWNWHFITQYVGVREADADSEKTDLLSLNDMRWLCWPGRRIMTTLFWRSEMHEAFSEKKTQCREATRIGEHLYLIEYNVAGYSKENMFRVDLQRGKICKCSIKKTEGIVSMYPDQTHIKVGEFDYFRTTDTSYFLQIDSNSDIIQITYELNDCEEDMIQLLAEENEMLRAQCGKKELACIETRKDIKKSLIDSLCQKLRKK